MEVDKLLERVMAQNDIIIRQNEELLRLLADRKDRTFDEVTGEVAAELTRRLGPGRG